MSQSPAVVPAPRHSIADVERQTGLPRATIRIWERRYGFPSPARDHHGERCYSQEQVAQLALMHTLVHQGHRPAKLVAAGADGIRKLAAPVAMARSQSPGPRALALMRLLKLHDASALRCELVDVLGRAGLAQFVGAELPMLNAQVGEAWAAGELEVHEEHLYSDCVAQVVREAIAKVPQAVRPEAPQVMLTTVPQEHHGLGLLMAQALFTLQGCPVVSLGIRLPVEQIASGARAYQADLVGLSFSASLNPTHVLRSLEELRGMLAPQVRLWAGGRNAALRRKVAGVRIVEDVLAIPALLAEDFALPPVEA